MPFEGPTPTCVAVLGEAPGPQEDAAGRPFVGPAGQLLKKVLEETGFEISQLTFFNTVSCYPKTIEGKGRTPALGEVDACRVNLDAQLLLLSPRWVVLTGNIPLQALRPDLRIGRAHGRPFQRGDTVFFPVFHPAAALRNSEWRTALRTDLELLAKLVCLEKPWWEYVPETCVVCGVRDEVWRCDAEGMVYCTKDLPRAASVKQRKKENEIPIGPPKESESRS